MLRMVWLFLLEELRLRSSFSSPATLFMFPVILMLGALGGYVISPHITDSITYADIHISVMSGLFIFGISMGGIAFLGKDFIERALGPVTMLAASVSLQPVGEKRMYFTYFLHDLVFYMGLVLIPLTIGFGMGTITRPTEVERFLLISSSQWAAFLLGLSLSFLLSSILTSHNRRALVLIPLAFMPLFIVQIVTGKWRGFVVPQLGIDTGSWIFLIMTLFLSATYIAGGVILFDSGSLRSNTSNSGSYTSLHAISRFLYPKDGPLRSLMARDLINFLRGKAIVRVLFSFTVPILVIVSMAGIIGGMDGAPIQFNMVFFSVMIAFFTVSVYVNLTNLDFYEFDQTVPISTHQLIGVKIREHLLISYPLSILLLLAIAAALGQWGSLLYGLPLLLIAVPYMGFVTAYLTGLWTNTMLFNGTVFVQYVILTVLPLMSATMLSYFMGRFLLLALLGLFTIVLLETIGIVILKQAIVMKWGRYTLSSSQAVRL